MEAPAAAIAVSNEAATVLVLTGRFLNLVPMLVERVASATFAGLAHFTNRTTEERLRVFRELLTVINAFTGIGLGIAFAFTGPVLRLWVGENLYAGHGLAMLILICCLFMTRMTSLSNILLSNGFTSDSAQWMTAYSILRVACLVVLSGVFGLAGIAGAGALAAGITMFGVAHAVQQRLGMPMSEAFKTGSRSTIVCVLLGTGWAALWPASRILDRVVVPNWRRRIITICRNARLGCGVEHCVSPEYPCARQSVREGHNMTNSFSNNPQFDHHRLSALRLDQAWYPGRTEVEAGAITRPIVAFP